MQITTVTFARTVNTGDFTNFRIEATAHVQEGDAPAGVAVHLQTYVDEVCNERVARMRRPGARGGKDAGELEPWEV